MLSTVVFAVLSSGLFLNSSSGNDCIVDTPPTNENNVSIVNQCVPVNTSSPVNNDDNYLNGKIDFVITYIPEVLSETQ